MTTRIGGFIVAAIFATSLANYVGTRMSAEALSLAVGVLCGVAASIPVSLGLLIALTRRRDSVVEAEAAIDYHLAPYASPRHRQPQNTQPQIIVIAPPQASFAAGAPFYSQFGTMGQPTSPPFGTEAYEEMVEGRDWRIIGDD